MLRRRCVGVGIGSSVLACCESRERVVGLKKLSCADMKAIKTWNEVMARGR